MCGWTFLALGSDIWRKTKSRIMSEFEIDSDSETDVLLSWQDEYHRGALKIDDKFGGSATDQYEAMFKVGV